MDPLLVIEGLTKRFGPITAVNGVSFRLHRGEVLGFLGPNGAGKSTTMRMITGYLAPSSGRVFVCRLSVKSTRGGTLSLEGPRNPKRHYLRRCHRRQ
jgi:ABC-2 type transport system ATP-binding protein